MTDMKARSNPVSRISHLPGFLLLILLALHPGALAQNRTIALVYDDSGSMKGDPSRAVNYALQVMVGLLHPQDKFYVVKMSRPEELKEIDLNAKANEIQTIRQWKWGGDTYFKAAETAMRALESDPGKNRDKWLIIFTDGVMEIHAGHEALIEQFVTHSGAKTIILNINAAENPLANAYKNIGQAEIYQSTARLDTIRKNMEHIALSVMSLAQSGLAVDAAADTVKINTVFPLKRLILLEQETNKKNKLSTIAAAIDHNGVKIAAADFYDALIPDKIYGRVTHITQSENSSRVIPEGEIRLTFNEKVDVSRFKFLPEVAAKLEAKASGANIKEVKGNVYRICEYENEAEVEARLTTPDGSGLPPELLKNTKVVIYYDNLQEEMKWSDPVFTLRIRVRKTRLPVSVSAEYPGYFRYRTNVFMIEKVYCKLPDKAGIQPGIAYPPVKVTELANAPFIDLYPLINKKPASKEQFKDLFLARLDDSGIDIEIQETGTHWKVRPKAKWGIPCFTKTGKQNVILELKSTRQDMVPESGPTVIVFNIENVSFFKKCLPFILSVLALIILTWYLLGIIKKPRFCRGSEIIYQRSTQFVQNKAITFRLAGNFFQRYLLPYKPETAKIEGMKFKAGKRCNYLELPKEVQTERMYISGDSIEEPGRRDYRISAGDELLAEHRNYKETYKYSRL